MNEERLLERAARVLEKRLTHGDALTSPQMVRDYLKFRIGALPHEVFMGIWLDSQHRVIACEELFRGTLTQTSVYPREVVKSALKHNAGAMIAAHNHPSGIAQPSIADEMLTKLLKDALAMVEVRLLDHFIVCGNQVLSFSERGLM